VTLGFLSLVLCLIFTPFILVVVFVVWAPDVNLALLADSLSTGDLVFARKVLEDLSKLAEVTFASMNRRATISKLCTRSTS
jgi:hypothetical protein